MNGYILQWDIAVQYEVLELKKNTLAVTHLKCIYLAGEPVDVFFAIWCRVAFLGQ